MSVSAAIGQAQSLDGREAGLQATHQALNRLSGAQPSLAFVISSHQYDSQQVVNGVSGLTGNTPLIGFSSPAGLTNEGPQAHSVLVALLSMTDAKADVNWMAGYTQGTREVGAQVSEMILRNPKHTALVFADGFNADVEQLCSSLPPGAKVTGGLSSGDLHSGNAYQMGGSQSGSGGLALVQLEGQIRTGIGYGHGWQPMGSHFRVTRSRGFWLRTLDGRPASEAYANLFGYPARDWSFPPLSHLTRIYPLGIEQPEGSLLVRSPLRVEADGSFRMNATIDNGSEAYLLIGSLTSCIESAQAATRQALEALEGARPVLALVLVDIAWQMLFDAQPGADIAAVRQVLGEGVHIAGGYTLGQMVPNGESIPQFLNQHMVVILFGEPPEK